RLSRETSSSARHAKSTSARVDRYRSTWYDRIRSPRFGGCGTRCVRYNIRRRRSLELEFEDSVITSSTQVAGFAAAPHLVCRPWQSIAAMFRTETGARELPTFAQSARGLHNGEIAPSRSRLAIAVDRDRAPRDGHRTRMGDPNAG